MTIAIGDLQGCSRPLHQLLRLVDAPAGEPIWFCGDLVNRGPESLASLRTVMALGPQAVTVLGNHDLHLLATAAGVRAPRKGDTLRPILQAPDHRQLIDWLRSQPLAHHQGDYLLVHAGMVPMWDALQTVDLAREVEQVLQGPHWGDFMAVMYGNEPCRWDDSLRGDDRLRAIVNILTRIRYVDATGALDLSSTSSPGQAPAGLCPWFDLPQRRTAGKSVVFGHWSTLGLLNQPNLVGLDTGCVWGGCLSAMRLETRQLFQVHCSQAAAPAAR